MCSDHHDVPAISLQPVPHNLSNSSDIERLELNSHQLSLVFEPEASAVYCMEHENNCPGLNDCYLTVDIRGGTIDITVHQVCEDGTLNILDFLMATFTVVQKLIRSLKSLWKKVFVILNLVVI